MAQFFDTRDPLEDFIRRDIPFYLIENIRDKRNKQEQKQKEDQEKQIEIDKLLLENISKKIGTLDKHSTDDDIDSVGESINALYPKFDGDELMRTSLDVLNTEFGIRSTDIREKNESMNHIKGLFTEIESGLKDEDLSTDLSPLIQDVETYIEDNQDRLRGIPTLNKQLDELKKTASIYSLFADADDPNKPGFQLQSTINNTQYKYRMQSGYDNYIRGRYNRAYQDFDLAKTIKITNEASEEEIENLKFHYYDEEGKFLPHVKDRMVSYIDPETDQEVSNRSINTVFDLIEIHKNAGNPTKALRILEQMPIYLESSNESVLESKSVAEDEKIAAAMKYYTSAVKDLNRLHKEGKNLGSKDVRKAFDDIDDFGKSKWLQESDEANEVMLDKVENALFSLIKQAKGGDNEVFKRYLGNIENAPMYSESLLDEDGELIITKADHLQKLLNELSKSRNSLSSFNFEEQGTVDWVMGVSDYDVDVVSRMLDLLDLRTKLQEIVFLQSQKPEN